MTSKLPLQTDRARTRLYLVDTVPAPDGSAVYPVAAAYAAAVDALTMRVRFVDVGIGATEAKDIRALISSVRPDETIWISDRRAKPFEVPTIEPRLYDFREPVFPILDRWQAEHYILRTAPGARPWQLQIHALPLGADWFMDYVVDLRRRFPAFTGAVVFNLEACDYLAEALDVLAVTLHMPWSCAAGPRLMSDARLLATSGCIGVMVNADTAVPDEVCAAKLCGLRVHAMGTDPTAGLRMPFDFFRVVGQQQTPKTE